MRSIACVSLILGFALAGCGQSGESESETKGVATALLWDKIDLELCVDRQSGDFGPEVDALVPYLKESIEREYTEDKTRLHFFGFEDCAARPQADVGMILVSAPPQRGYEGLAGVASQIGTWNSGADEFFAGVPRPSVKLFLSSMRQFPGRLVSYEEFVAEVALHELGHIAGLFHEHAHPQSTCDRGESARDKFMTMPGYAAESYLDHGTPYDPLSVMSYCKGDAWAFGQYDDPSLRGQRPVFGLSAGDRAFLTQIYANASSSGRSGGTTDQAGTKSENTTPATTDNGNNPNVSGSVKNNAEGSASSTTAPSSKGVTQEELDALLERLREHAKGAGRNG